ncbi:MAG: HD domain-containing phosphohydrolase [Acidimicrobiales bacterium]|jgi:HD-GYP domain-containing protein (c-di-GMP phosphodiesterase class II)
MSTTTPNLFDTLATHQELLPALQRAETVYDRGTAQHSARVGKICGLIGQVLGLSGPDIGALTWTAVLHDVGKLTVSEAVLHKHSGPFTDADWSELRQHAMAGESLVLALGPQMQPMASAVRSHHERWDGSGYPDGLRGEEIPLWSRIVAVADAYDLLAHEQPYRHEVFSHAAAVDLVLDGRGRRFDPEVVDAFVFLDHRGVLAPIAQSMQHRPQAVSAISAARRTPVGTRRRRTPRPVA